MELGRAKRLGGRGGFKVIIWENASHKERRAKSLWWELIPLDTMGLSNYYYVFNTILTIKIQHNIFHFVNTT